MVWQKDKLKPTQPYFVLDTEDFRQEVYLRQGISHFYTFHIKDGSTLRTVPDGCIDFSFEYADGKFESYVCGTRLSYQCEQRSSAREVFGVRFMPGKQPKILNVTMKELLNQNLPFEESVISDTEWLKELEKETDFYQRIRVFLENFTKAEKAQEEPFGPRLLVQSVKQMVYDSNGRIQISDLEDRTGYSERYINKAFVDEMGFSPKTFCKIIQFQRALEALNSGTPESMTETAVALGYYDQPHFIRCFKEYAGVTPKKYLNLVNELDYKNKIHY